MGDATVLAEDRSAVPEAVLEQARAVFAGYAAMVAEIREVNPHPGTLPKDPEYLAWTLAAVAPIPLPDQQAVLEADSAGHRLALLIDLFRRELAAMNVIPSLPATRVARTGWSPN